MQLKQFVVGQRGEFAAGACAQPFAMAMEMRAGPLARRAGGADQRSGCGASARWRVPSMPNSVRRLFGLGKGACSGGASQPCRATIQSAWTGGLKRPAGDALKIS